MLANPHADPQTAATATPTLPVLDLEAYRRGATGAREQLAAELHEALTQIGFFFIVNHGVPQDLVKRVFAEAERFHALPLAEKMALKYSSSNTGYVALGGGRSRSSALDTHHKPNLNAAFFMKRERPADDPNVLAGKRLYGLNQWPKHLPGFRDTLLEYFHVMEALGKSMLPLFAMALDLPPNYLETFFQDAQATLRLSIYPPIEHEEHQYGLAPHTDGGFMTFLPQNDIPGLAIRPEGWDWMAPLAIPSSYLINSGDLLRRWSNDRFLSTSHRARNASNRNRYAIPFFFNPASDVQLECLPTCQGPDNPPKYAPVTYEAYNRWFTGNNYHSNPDEPPAPRP